MEGRIIEVWASLALTEWKGRFHLWEPVGGDDYSRDLKPEGFESEDKAREYARRRVRIRVAPESKPEP